MVLYSMHCSMKNCVYCHHCEIHMLVLDACVCLHDTVFQKNCTHIHLKSFTLTVDCNILFSYCSIRWLTVQTLNSRIIIKKHVTWPVHNDYLIT